MTASQTTVAMISRDRAASKNSRSLRAIGARWSAVVAVALLAYGAITLAFVWCLAALTDRLPTQSDIAYYERTGNGFWDHARDLKLIVSDAMMAPTVAAAFALVALVVRPTRKTAILFAVCLVSSLAITFTHFWLID